MNKYQEALKYVTTFVGIGKRSGGKAMFIESVKTLQELVDKATPKKLVRFDFSKELHCPNCGSGNGKYEGTVGTHNYCHFCGQALDWSDEYDK